MLVCGRIAITCYNRDREIFNKETTDTQAVKQSTKEDVKTIENKCLRHWKKTENFEWHNLLSAYLDLHPINFNRSVDYLNKVNDASLNC